MSSSGASLREYTISRSLVGSVALLAGLAILGIGIAGYDYYNLRNNLLDTRALEKEVAGKDGELAAQRRQIQKFADEINGLKTSILELGGFEEKIRIIANVKKSKKEESLFGVGGSIPEDLDTRIGLTEKHNSLVREMHGQVDQLGNAALAQEKGFEALIKYLEDQRNLLAATPTIRPVKGGWVTSDFGYRKSPFTGRREFHKGYDIANKSGTPIMATADGVVTFSGKKGLLGKTVVIDHGHGMVTRYGHNKSLLKKKGEKVKRGEEIAKMGNTGRSTGSHVHYEVRLNGVPVNPKKYMLD